MSDAPGYSIEELSEASGLSPRGIRFYIARGLLPRPVFRGTATRYGQEYLDRLRAIARLRKGGKRLDVVRRELGKMTAEEIARLAAQDAPAGAPPPPVVPRPLARTLPAGFLGPYRPALARPSERWERVELCPGVELIVRGEADGEAWRVAQEIVAMFGGAATDGP
jgi:DNA-binding transcriptional MerR regulator